MNLVMSPLAGIFAAGNRAMVKTSGFTPATSALFEEVVGRYFAPEELAFVGGGPDVGKAFTGTAVRPPHLHRRDRHREAHPPRRGR
ncbi:hypothetical protein AB5I41_15280 [Sphingomonas sp. MMS24-JH45]